MPKKKVELEATVEEMLSDDYKERFWAEYWQVRTRYEKLTVMVDKYLAGKLDFEPDCPVQLLMTQASYMRVYMQVLEARAKIEKIKL